MLEIFYDIARHGNVSITIKDLADTYQLDKCNWSSSVFFARSTEPHEFRCRICGAMFMSLWVGKNHCNPTCDECVEKISRNIIPKQEKIQTAHNNIDIKVLPEIESWLRNKSIGHATLSGIPGSGKTTQVVLLANRAAAAGKTYRIVADRDLCGSDEDAREAMASALCADLLAIDEVGRRLTPAAADRICELIDRREIWAARRKTLIATNLGADALYAADPRLASRLMGGAWVEMASVDRRVARHGGSGL